MADKIWHQAEGSLEQRVATLYGKITFGATGAVASTDHKGVTSVARDSAGQYTITLDESYNELLWYGDKILEADVTDPTAVGVHTRVEAEAVSSATPTVTIQFYDFTDGSEADPADGSTLFWKMELRNSTVD